MRTRRWRHPKLVLVTLVGLFAVLVLVVLLAIQAHARATSVARRLPPATATSAEVLAVYLRAARAHDCALTEALTAPHAPESPDLAWCGGRMSSMFDDHPDLLGFRNIGRMDRSGGAENGGITEECIPVDVTETNMSGAEPGTLRGWNFCFTRTAAGWRLYDEGY